MGKVYIRVGPPPKRRAYIYNIIYLLPNINIIIKLIIGTDDVAPGGEVSDVRMDITATITTYYSILI